MSRSRESTNTPQTQRAPRELDGANEAGGRDVDIWNGPGVGIDNEPADCPEVDRGDSDIGSSDGSEGRTDDELERETDDGFNDGRTDDELEEEADDRPDDVRDDCAERPFACTAF